MREVGLRETGLGEGFRPVHLSGCGSNSAGGHRLWNAEVQLHSFEQVYSVFHHHLSLLLSCFSRV